MEKKLIIITILLSIFANFAFAMQVEEPPPPPAPTENYTVTEVITIHHLLFEKVFPGVEFKQWTFIKDFGVRKAVNAIIDGDTLGMPRKINVLYAKLKDITPANPRDFLETYVRFFFWTQSASMEIKKYEEINIIRRNNIRGDHPLNHRFEIEIVSPRTRRIQRHEMFIALKDDQVIWAETNRIENGERKAHRILMPELIRSSDKTGGGQ